MNTFRQDIYKMLNKIFKWLVGVSGIILMVVAFTTYHHDLQGGFLYGLMGALMIIVAIVGR